MATAQLLLVEDDTAMRQMLGSLFTGEGYAVAEAANATDALRLARDRDFDVVLSDIKMPGKSGLELAGELRELQPSTLVVMMTAFGTPDTEVDALRAGAFDYTPKPFEPEEVLRTVGRAVARRRVEARARQLRAGRAEAETPLVAQSEAMREVSAIIGRAASCDASVLVIGQSGTGKEVVARTLHARSLRRGRPFLRVHCGAPPEFLERAFFGHDDPSSELPERGLFERADGGTLFLDAVGELPRELQAKLARVLKEREVCTNRVADPVSIDVRIVASTSRDLEVEMEAGLFLDELFYRLNVIPVRLRPLRERPEDVAGLAELFLRRHGKGRERRLSRPALRRLQFCPWRGNARELENVIARAITLSDADVIHVGDLSLEDALDEEEARSTLGLGLSEAARIGLRLRDVEDSYIDQMLRHTNGRKGAAAKRLGIDRKTLYRRDRSQDRSPDDR